MHRIARSLVVASALVVFAGGIARAQEGGAEDNKARLKKIAEDEKKARDATRAKKYDEAARLLEVVLADLEKVELSAPARKRAEMGVRYNLACVLALGAKEDTAVAELGEAIDLGAVFSPDVTVGGRVSTKAEIREGKTSGTITYELAGYGSASATTWGKTAPELEKDSKGDEK